MTSFKTLTAASLALFLAAPVAGQTSAEAFLDSLSPRRGQIDLPGDVARLNLPSDFYYLSPADTERVLVDAWGNPPGGESLGMIVPAQYTVLDNESWAVIVSYEEEGYVDDSDAADIDYQDLLEQMKDDTRASSDYRVEQGYESVALIGWAAPPRYDAAAKKLYWAKELAFGTDGTRSLNYDVRVLGRKGVLVMSAVANMEQFAEVEAATPDVLALASFTDGNRYADFDPDIDQVAAYGIGALVAGKLAAKAGLFAKLLPLLLILKKFWFVGLIALYGGFKALTSRR